MIRSHSPSVYAVCSECQAKKERKLCADGSTVPGRWGIAAPMLPLKRQSKPTSMIVWVLKNSGYDIVRSIRWVFYPEFNQFRYLNCGKGKVPNGCSLNITALLTTQPTLVDYMLAHKGGRIICLFLINCERHLALHFLPPWRTPLAKAERILKSCSTARAIAVLLHLSSCFLDS